MTKKLENLTLQLYQQKTHIGSALDPVTLTFDLLTSASMHAMQVLWSIC